jgi:hypothetical protein
MANINDRTIYLNPIYPALCLFVFSLKLGACIYNYGIGYYFERNKVLSEESQSFEYA